MTIYTIHGRVAFVPCKLRLVKESYDQRHFLQDTKITRQCITGRVDGEKKLSRLRFQPENRLRDLTSYALSYEPF